MNAVKTYDVIIIGAGPAGIFTALELADTGLSILIVEKGQDIRERIATSRNKNALPKDKVRNVVCGWGGAGAFSDGKLTLTTEYGGNLDDYMSKAELMEKIAYVDDVYCRFGGADRKVYGDENKECIRQMQRKAAAADLRLIPARIRHLGTDVNAQILTNMRDFLDGKIDIDGFYVQNIFPFIQGQARTMWIVLSLSFFGIAILIALLYLITIEKDLRREETLLILWGFRKKDRLFLYLCSILAIAFPSFLLSAILSPSLFQPVVQAIYSFFPGSLLFSYLYGFLALFLSFLFVVLVFLLPLLLPRSKKHDHSH